MRGSVVARRWNAVAIPRRSVAPFRARRETRRHAGRTAAPLRTPANPNILRAHGDERVDDWFWLRERQSRVRAYLEAENAYTDAIMRPTEPLQARIYDEIASRVQQTDTSAPVPDGPYEYYHRTVEGSQYAIHCRRRRGGGAEEIVLDLNVLADGHTFLEVGDLEVDPSHAIAAYTVDTTGGERYELRFRDLASGATSPTSCPTSTTGSRGPTTARRSSTCGPTRPCDPTRSGATRSARRPPTTSPCSATTTSASTSRSRAAAAVATC